MASLREDLVWIHDAVRVKNTLNGFHVGYHLIALGVVQVGSLLETDTMLRADTSADTLHIVEDEGVNSIGKAVLQIKIIVARCAHVQVNISITDMAITGHIYGGFFSFGELRRGLDLSACIFHNLVEMLRVQAEVVLQSLKIKYSEIYIAFLNVRRCYLLADLPDLPGLGLILSHHTILSQH